MSIITEIASSGKLGSITTVKVCCSVCNTEMTTSGYFTSPNDGGYFVCSSCCAKMLGFNFPQTSVRGGVNRDWLAFLKRMGLREFSVPAIVRFMHSKLHRGSRNYLRHLPQGFRSSATRPPQPNTHVLRSLQF